MQRSCENKTGNLIIASLGAPCVASLLTIGIGENGPKNIIIYAIYYLMAVIPISYTASDLTLRKYDINTFEKITLGYPLAILGLGSLFAAGKALNVTAIVILLPILGIIYMAKSLAENRMPTETKYRNSYTYLLLLVYTISAVTLFLTFTLTAQIPSELYGSNVYEDTLWTIGNTWSALRNGLPLEDSRFSGVNLSYHLAQNLYYAATSWLTNINPIDLHLKIAPFYDIFYLIAGIATGAKIFWKINSLWPLIVVMPVIFSRVPITSFMIGSDPGIAEIWWNPISLVFGLGAFVLTVQCISNREGDKKIPIIYAALVFSLAMASKGLVGILIPSSVALWYVIQAVVERQFLYKSQWILVGVLILAFLIIKTALFSNVSGHTVMPRIEVSPFAVTIAGKFGLDQLVRDVYFIIGPVSRFVRFLFHTLCWNWITMPIIIWLLIAKDRSLIIKYRRFIGLMLCIVFVCAGIYGLNIFDNYWSNIYLYKYTIICTSLLLGITIQESGNKLISEKNQSMTTRSALKSYSLLAIMTVPMIQFFNSEIKSVGTEGWKTDRVMHTTKRPSAFINKSEYQAMTWIRENISDEVVLASDRREKKGWPGDYTSQVWFGYSAYSGKQFYNEGAAYNPFEVGKVSDKRWEIIQKLLDSKDEYAAKENWKSLDADYLIMTKRLSGQRNLALLKNQIEFENNGIVLVKNPWRQSLITIK